MSRRRMSPTQRERLIRAFEGLTAEQRNAIDRCLVAFGRQPVARVKPVAHDPFKGAVVAQSRKRVE